MHLFSSSLLGLLSPVLAQGSPYLGLELPPDLWSVLGTVAGAVAIFILGWLLAFGIASLVRSILKRVNIDNRIAQSISPQQAQNLNVEELVSTIVFWIIMILAFVAALNVLNLTTVSRPLNTFLDQIFAYLPKLGGAGIVIAIAWVLATVSRFAVIRLSRSLSLDERLMQTTEGTTPQGQYLLSDTLGSALYWLVLLFFLPMVLGILDLQGPLQPVQSLLNDFLNALPQIIKAVVIGLVGWVVARVVRRIVTNLLAAVGTDRLGRQFGLGRATSGQSLSWLLGTIVYVLILIPVAIAALEALNIQSITDPAVSMLRQILNAVPQVITAGVILFFGYLLGKFLSEIVSSLLTGLGFNNILQWIGLRAGTEPTPSPPVESPLEPNLPPLPPNVGGVVPEGRAYQSPGGLGTRSPSDIIGAVVWVAVVLLAAVAATSVLQLPRLADIVSALLLILGQVLVGLIVFAVGLYLANFAYSLIDSGNAQSRILGQTARIAIIALVSAMALQQIGIAPNIVNLAFGLLLGAIAVAIALAFGLGGRDVAADQLRDWLSSFKQGRTPRL
ncbi:mechanosensitive ion channel [Pantanalinema rosaneae]|uniref:mechanosensitive ion channel n=1 Tax=Pantanalinema rosaneae TaxID=1620701 RepID=UPI003D6EDD72